MVILGLGSNVGDRMMNMRRTLNAIKHITGVTVRQISPLYLSDALLPNNAPPEWNMPHLNLAIRIDTHLEPLALLKALKKIEALIGRAPEMRHWGPRIIDIDILAWDNLIIKNDALTVPHANLQDRPFALWPLADVAPFWIFPLSGTNQGKTAAQMVEAWGSRFNGKAPLRTRQIYQRLLAPQLVGIINVTPDSFSDGGQFLDHEKAFQQAVHLIEAGAEIIDIGAESTAPAAIPLSAEAEWARLEPILTVLKQSHADFILPPTISLDTRHAATAAKGLALGVNWINDVSGLDDPAMRDVIAQSSADCVVMHHINIPERREYLLPRDQDPTELVYAWGEKRLYELEQHGIPHEKVIFDPGIGFGKMAEQSLQLLKNAHVFKQLGARLLIGHSRKTFMSLLTNAPFAERDIETMVMSVLLAEQNIDYLRVHNVEMCARGLRTASAFHHI